MSPAFLIRNHYKPCLQTKTIYILIDLPVFLKMAALPWLLKKKQLICIKHNGGTSINFSGWYSK